MTELSSALVTGASAGLGAEFARQLAARGYHLVLVARRREKLEALAEELRSRHGREVLVIAADLGRPDAPQAIFEAVQQGPWVIDFLINNAGVSGHHLLEDRDWPAHVEFFQLMMLSVAQLCHLFIPGMRARGFGRIVNVASVAGRIPSAGGCNYGPSKAYVIALSEDLALTLRGSGVQVCALCPGFTHTDFHETAGLQDFKESLPAWLWYPAEVVVREGLRAVDKGKPVYVSGRIYRLLDPFFQSVITRRLFRR